MRADHVIDFAAEELKKYLRMMMPDRPKTISMRLLELHAEYIEGLAAFMIEKAKGNDHLAYEMFTEFFLEYGRHEFEIERYYDHGLAWLSYSLVVRKPPENYMGN